MSASDDLLERVDRVFEQHLLPVYHHDETTPFKQFFSRVVHTAKTVSGKLPFDNLEDAGETVRHAPAAAPATATLHAGCDMALYKLCHDLIFTSSWVV
jgi:hypothetical protein